MATWNHDLLELEVLTFFPLALHFTDELLLQVCLCLGLTRSASLFVQ